MCRQTMPDAKRQTVVDTCKGRRSRQDLPAGSASTSAAKMAPLRPWLVTGGYNQHPVLSLRGQVAPHGVGEEVAVAVGQVRMFCFLAAQVDQNAGAAAGHTPVGADFSVVIGKTVGDKTAPVISRVVDRRFNSERAVPDAVAGAV